MRNEYVEDWPRCSHEGCEAKICLALDSPFCFPHTPGDTAEKHAKIDARHDHD